MKSFSIKAKITRWFSLLILAILAAALALFMSAGSSVLRARGQRTLQELVQKNSEELTYTADRRDILYGYQYIIYGDGYLIIRDNFLDRENGVYCALFDSAGNLLYGTHVGAFPISADGVVHTLSRSDRDYYVYSHPLSGEGLDGLIMQGVVEKDANRFLLDGLFSEALLILPALALLAVGGGYILAAVMLRPIQKISQSAAAISGGEDLSRRIDIGGGNDEVHRLADSFNKMLARLETSFEEEKQFTSDISHELRTPVSVILAQSELAADNPDPKAMEVIRRQALRMKNILERMLSYSRLARLESLPARETVDISLMCRALAEEQRLKDCRGMHLHRDIQPDLLAVGDEGLIIQALVNLLDNACKYGAQDGNIWLTAGRNGRKVYIQVADDGPGIPRRQQGKVFGRFYRADTSRTRDAGGSLGLGLAVVRQIARLCGGSISLSSRPGKGCTFTLTLPAAENQ